MRLTVIEVLREVERGEVGSDDFYAVVVGAMLDIVYYLT